MSEINVTPFVDVMLVLLIVFMVTAPLLSAGVPVDLPEAEAKPLAIDKRADHRHRRCRRQDLHQGRRGRRSTSWCRKLTALAQDGLDERIYVRGDRAASYGTIMQVMGTINGAGFKHIGLVALSDTGQLSPRHAHRAASSRSSPTLAILAWGADRRCPRRGRSTRARSRRCRSISSSIDDVTSARQGR